MKKEDADQLIRCVKECWWRAGILLTLFFAFAVFAMGWWPEGDWGPGWGMISAISGLVIGALAIQISRKQAAFMEEKRNVSTDIIQMKIYSINIDASEKLHFLSERANALNVNKDLNFYFVVVGIRDFVISLDKSSKEIDILFKDISINEVHTSYYDYIKNMRRCFVDLYSRYKVLIVYSKMINRDYNDELYEIVRNCTLGMFEMINEAKDFLDLKDMSVVVSKMDVFRESVFKGKDSFIDFLKSIEKVN